jgi:hypothetical protein
MKTTDDFVNLEFDFDESASFVAELFIKEGRLRERERVIRLLHTLYDLECCCDSASFGDHYLDRRQPDNLVDLIDCDD